MLCWYSATSSSSEVPSATVRLLSDWVKMGAMEAYSVVGGGYFGGKGWRISRGSGIHLSLDNPAKMMSELLLVVMPSVN